MVPHTVNILSIPMNKTSYTCLESKLGFFGGVFSDVLLLAVLKEEK